VNLGITLGKNYRLWLATAISALLLTVGTHLPADPLSFTARVSKDLSVVGVATWMRLALAFGEAQTLSPPLERPISPAEQQPSSESWAAPHYWGTLNTPPTYSQDPYGQNHRLEQSAWRLREAAVASAAARAKATAILTARPGSIDEARTLFALGDAQLTPLVASYLPLSQEIHLTAVWNGWSEAELESLRQALGPEGGKSDRPRARMPTNSPDAATQPSEAALEAARALADWLQLATPFARAAPIRGYLLQSLGSRLALADAALRACERTRNGGGLSDGAATFAQEIEERLAASIMWEVRLADYLSTIFVWDDPDLRFAPLYDESFSAWLSDTVSGIGAEVIAYLLENCKLPT
jgi:hypothetical protein